jgi:hypothetical protein
MRPIDADKLSEQYETSMCELLKSTNCENISIEALSLLCGAKLIADAPTVCAVPVKHGRWLNMRNGNADCSVCGRHVIGVYDDDNADRFCRCCGAKMDLEAQGNG